MGLPSNIPKRGLSIEEAAEYCGVSASSIERHGPRPTKIGERNVYDRKALDLWLDKLANLGAAYAGGPIDPLGDAIRARKNAVRNQAH